MIRLIASHSKVGASRARAREGAPASARVPRLLAVALVSSLVLWTGVATPASAALLGRAGASDEPSRLEERAYARWWDGQLLGEGLALGDMPLDELRDSAAQALAAGASKRELRAVLFSDAGRDILAGNAAGGQGRPSPYLEYFKNNPAQLGRLGGFLLDSPTYLVGPGGTQEQLFSQFTGLRASYLASLGLVEVNGRIVDPRSPYLTPYFASLFMGPPEPLPQPQVALNVGTT